MVKKSGNKIAIALGAMIGLGSLSCSEMDTSPTSIHEDYNCNDSCEDGLSAIVTIESSVDTTAIDICADFSVSLNYNNTIPGITGMTIVEKTKDTCGYIGTYGPAIIGSMREYQIVDLQGDAEAVELNKQKYVNDLITVQMYPKDSQRNNSTIVWPSNTTQMEVIIGDISDSNYGVGHLLNNGVLDVVVHAYGRDMNSRESGSHFVDIIDPTLMPYHLRLDHPRISIQRVSCADIDSLLQNYPTKR